MRTLLIITCCLFFSGGIHAQMLPLNSAAAAQKSTPQISLLTYSDHAVTTGDADHLPSGNPAARFAATQTGASRFDADVNQQMETFDGIFSSQGLSRANTITRGGLANSRQSEYTYQLMENRVYGFAAVCDRDCSDLDLVLVNSDGETVKRDIATDDKPIITYRPTQSGQYRLQVRMASCSQSPCRFGLAAYVPANQPSGTNSQSGGTSSYDQIVTRQMELFDSNFSSQGLSRSGSVVRGGLANNRRSEYTYSLVAGQSYGFAAVCDQDCSDLDLVLVNSAGQTVKQDMASDSAPVIIHRPARSGQYRLQVRMADCSQSPCRFGLAAYK